MHGLWRLLISYDFFASLAFPFKVNKKHTAKGDHSEQKVVASLLKAGYY